MTTTKKIFIVQKTFYSFLFILDKKFQTLKYVNHEIPDRIRESDKIPDKIRGSNKIPDRIRGSDKIPDKIRGSDKIPDRIRGSDKIPDNDVIMKTQVSHVTAHLCQVILTYKSRPPRPAKLIFSPVASCLN
jgi:hypothetical protein